MFTGLVEDVGHVVSATPQAGVRALVIRPDRLSAGELTVGDSIAVDGTCLTVTEVGEGTFAVTAVDETLRRTTLGGLEPGEQVNLERPMRLGDRLDGHLVQGHVDGTGELAERRESGDNLELTIAAPAGLMRYLVEKGSVTVDGVSLTVVRVTPKSFAIALIPHTRAATTLGDKPVGARINLEVDMIAKYVERLLGGYTATGEREP